MASLTYLKSRRFVRRSFKRPRRCSFWRLRSGQSCAFSIHRAVINPLSTRCLLSLLFSIFEKLLNPLLLFSVLLLFRFLLELSLTPLDYVAVSSQAPLYLVAPEASPSPSSLPSSIFSSLFLFNQTPPFLPFCCPSSILLAPTFFCFFFWCVELPRARPPLPFFDGHAAVVANHETTPRATTTKGGSTFGRACVRRPASELPFSVLFPRVILSLFLSFFFLFLCVFPHPTPLPSFFCCLPRTTSVQSVVSSTSWPGFLVWSQMERDVTDVALALIVNSYGPKASDVCTCREE